MHIELFGLDIEEEVRKLKIKLENFHIWERLKKKKKLSGWFWEKHLD